MLLGDGCKPNCFDMSKEEVERNRLFTNPPYDYVLPLSPQDCRIKMDAPITSSDESSITQPRFRLMHYPR